MSIMKNPIFLALLTTGVVFAVTYYYYNYYCQPAKSAKRSDKVKRGQKRQEKTVEINETMVLSSAIAGLIAWYIASSYFSDQTKQGGVSGEQDSVNDRQNESIVPGSRDINTGSQGGVQSVQGMHGGVKGGILPGGQSLTGGSAGQKIPTLASDDSTRSYNLIGSGVNIPKSDLKIPGVLIDYQ